MQMNDDDFIEHEETDDEFYWQPPSEYEDMDLDYAS